MTLTMSSHVGLRQVIRKTLMAATTAACTQRSMLRTHRQLTIAASVSISASATSITEATITAAAATTAKPNTIFSSLRLQQQHYQQQQQQQQQPAPHCPATFVQRQSLPSQKQQPHFPLYQRQSTVWMMAPAHHRPQWIRHYHQSILVPLADGMDDGNKNNKAVTTSPTANEVPVYSTPELTADAAKHKAGLDDPDLPFFQNPLHHKNPDMEKMFREDFESDQAFEAAVHPVPPLDTGDGGAAGTVPAPEYLQALADEIVHLNMLEMNELVNKIAHHYGFHEGMLSPNDDGAEGADDDDDLQAGPAAVEEVKTSFDIKLVGYDASAKIKVIKEVRALAGLGLKEAKELVESAPKVIHKGVKQEEANEIKAKLEEVGATIEIV